MKKYLTKKRIICYLFCFILVCTAVLGITYARYRTEVAGAAAASTADVALNSSIEQRTEENGARGEERDFVFRHKPKRRFGERSSTGIFSKRYFHRKPAFDL